MGAKQKYSEFVHYAGLQDINLEKYNESIDYLKQGFHRFEDNKCGLPKIKNSDEEYDDIDICQNTDLEVCTKMKRKDQFYDKLKQQDTAIQYITEKRRRAIEKENLK